MKMKITLEELEKVMEETGLDYKAAKEALEKVGGDAEAAIRSMNTNGSEEISNLIDKVKALVKEGNVDRIQITRKDEVILSLPVNVGIGAGLVGLLAFPWAMIAGVIAAYGLECRIEVIKNDGSKDEIN